MSADERRILATMPLHAITATYGEAGLRERFAIEITRFADADQTERPRSRPTHWPSRAPTDGPSPRHDRVAQVRIVSAHK